MQELILATSNAGKIKELQALLTPWPCVAQTSLGISSIAETGLSFIENAILKARHASRIANKPALADDSGLVVRALQDRPGIYSARFAGEQASDADNMRLLLTEMVAVPEYQRHAYFYCAIALLQHADDPSPLIATGRLNGRITTTQQGEQGFGYDPIFYLDSYQCTIAQLPLTVKNRISHRAQALAQLRIQLDQLDDIAHFLRMKAP